MDEAREHLVHNSDVDPNVTQAVDPNRTQSLVGLNVTQTIQPVQCPICKTFNPAGEAFCVECGLLFSSALPDDAFGAPAVRLPCLVDDAGREHFLKPGDNIVGREGDVLLTDARASRKHAILVLSGDSISVKDLGSTNGTFVNDRNLEADEVVELATGDKVRFAGAEMVLSVPGDAGATKMLEETPTQATSDDSKKPASAYELTIDGEAVTLDEGSNTMGRRPDNDIILTDPFASGAHAVIEISGGEAHFTDVGSTNGTFLNGAKLVANQRTTISIDDEILIGETKLRLVELGKD